MKKKNVSIILAVVILLVVIVSCVIMFGGGGSKGDGNSDNSEMSGDNVSSKELSVEDLSIDDFEWETYPSVCDGDDCYVASLTNNSNYDITSVNLYYKVKDGVSDEELSVYNDFMEEGKDYSLEDYAERYGVDYSPRNIILFYEDDIYIESGKESFTNSEFLVGIANDWSLYYYATEEQFELMEPKELRVSLVNNNKLQYADYDFDTKTWELEEGTNVVDIWSKTDIAKELPKPKGTHFVVHTDKDDKYVLTSYGIENESMYKDYVEELKAAGFEEKYYSGYSPTRLAEFDGVKGEYTVNVAYLAENRCLQISIKTSNES